MKEGSRRRLRPAAIVARMVLASAGFLVVPLAVLAAVVLIAILLRAERLEELRNRSEREK